MAQTNECKYIYVMQAGTSGIHKIGKSSNPEQRLGGVKTEISYSRPRASIEALGIQFESMFPLSLVIVIPCGPAAYGTQHMEHFLKWHFRDQRVFGEFFHLSPRDLRFIRLRGKVTYKKALLRGERFVVRHHKRPNEEALGCLGLRYVEHFEKAGK